MRYVVSMTIGGEEIGSLEYDQQPIIPGIDARVLINAGEGAQWGVVWEHIFRFEQDACYIELRCDKWDPQDAVLAQHLAS